jgi:hypothetical protein
VCGADGGGSGHVIYGDRMDDPPTRPHRILTVASVPRGLAGGGLDARLDEFAADARVDEAVRTRARERWLRRQAEESGTVAGALADLRDAGVPVSVQTLAGSTHRGVVQSVGADHAVVADAQGRGVVVVVLAALTSVRTGPGEAAVLGDRPSPASPAHLVDVLTQLADEQAVVRVVTAGGEALGGVLRTVGQDVVVVEGAGSPPSVSYVPVGAVAEVVVDG